MASTDPATFIQAPLSVIGECFDKATTLPAAAAAAAGPPAPDLHACAAVAFREFLTQHPGALAAVPVVHPGTWSQDSADGGRLPNCSLVRFRGMVMDMLDPQFFIGAHKDPATGRLLCTMYRDTLTPEEETAAASWEPHQTMERRPLVLGPIPGEAPWVMGGSSSSNSNKRSLPVEDANDAEDSVAMDTDAGAAKVPRTEDGDAGDMVVDGSTAVPAAAAAAGAVSVPPQVPAADPQPFRCLTYLYDGEDEGKHPPKLNEALDVIAVLSYPTAAEKEDMMRAESGVEEDAYMGMEKLALSLEPRLHVLLWERARLLPAVPGPDLEAAARFFAGAAAPCPRPVALSPPLATGDASVLPQLRAELLGYLTRSLGGDALAAEYLLLTLLSRVRLRSSGGEVVGHLPLNLSRVKVPGFARGLAQLLRSTVARSRLLEVTLATLGDEGAWISRKDYETNALSTTVLQVTPGTVLVLDESGLETGRLDAEGVANVRCLMKLIESQKTACNFGFYQLEFETDCPITLVSQSRSIFHGGALCEVPMVSAAAAEDAATTDTSASSAAFAASATPPPPPASLEGTVAPEALAALRLYLAALAGFPVEIDKALALQAEQEYVSVRGTDEGKHLTPEDLSRWLTVTRLLCASYGESKVCMAKHWARMRELEKERTHRLRTLPKGNVAQ